MLPSGAANALREYVHGDHLILCALANEQRALHDGCFSYRRH